MTSGPAMDGCARVREAIRQGAVDDPAVVRHAEGCDACRELLDDQALVQLLAAGSGDEPVDDALAAAIGGRVRAEAPSRARGPRLALALGTVLATAVGLGAATMRPDLATVPMGAAAVQLAALAVAVGVGVALVSRPPWRAPLSPAAHRGGMAALWAVPALALVLPLSEPVGLSGLAAATLACLGFGSVMVVLSVGVFGALFRRDTLLSARWPLAAATGAMAGNLALVLHCPLSDPGHVLLGHVALGLLAAAGAGLVGAATRGRATL